MNKLNTKKLVALSILVLFCFCMFTIPVRADWAMFRSDAAHTGVGSGNAVIAPVMQLWNYTTVGYVTSSPAVVNGVVYVGTNAAMFYALNASSGAQLWNFTGGGAQYSLLPLLLTE